MAHSVGSHASCREFGDDDGGGHWRAHTALIAQSGSDAGFAVLLPIALGVAYFVPSVIAGTRCHRNVGAIIAPNLLPGWTVTA